ncbi:MAG TPA: hypothetical protein VFY14_07020 [Streptomyces sp.]|nr:hypothetical protein [Streptomyces sp.]
MAVHHRHTRPAPRRTLRRYVHHAYTHWPLTIYTAATAAAALYTLALMLQATGS